MALSPKYIEVMLPFLNYQLSEDDFHEMVSLCCCISDRVRDRFVKRATEAIRDFFAEQRRENNILYNPYRNISLDQSYGDSNSCVSDWLNVSDWREWD